VESARTAAPEVLTLVFIWAVVVLKVVERED
jgi:hypothetical protein